VLGGFCSTWGVRNFGEFASIIGASVRQKKSVYDTIAGITNGTVTSLFQKPLYNLNFVVFCAHTGFLL
jgi:hypothetical protein